AVLSLAAASRAQDVTGRVIDVDGRPVPGAEVFVTCRLGTLAETHLEPVRSDEQGAWRVRDARTEPGQWLVAVAVTPGGLGWSGTAGGALTVRLGGVRTAVLRVLDPERRPVAGMHVEVSRLGEVDPGTSGADERGPDVRLSAGDPVCAVLGAVTDAAGECRVRVTSTGKSGVRIGHPGFQTSDFWLGNDPVTVHELRPGAALRGRVTDLGGRPVAGVTVQLKGRTLRWSTAETQADGTYQFDGLQAGDGRVYVTHAPADYPVGSSADCHAETGKILPVPDLVLGDTVLVKGRLVALGSGEPLGPAQVQGFNRGADVETAAVTAGADGRLELRLAPGKWEFWPTTGPPGYTLEFDRAKPVQLAVEEGEREVTVELTRAYTVRGRVLDEADRPVAGAEVQLHQGRFVWDAKTDAEGRFAVDRVPAGERVELEAGVVGGRTAQPVSFADAGQATDALLRLTPSGAAVALTTQVVDPWGRPLPGVDTKLSVHVVRNGRGSEYVQRAASDATGACRFELADADAGVLMRGSAPGLRRLKGGDPVPGGGPLRLSDLVLARWGAAVSGQVVDAKGKPAAGAKVICLEAADHTVACDARGRFTADNLPDAPLRLVALQGHRAVGTVAARPGRAVTIKVAEPPAATPAAKRKLARELLDEAWRVAALRSSWYSRVGVVMAAVDPREVCRRVRALPEGQRGDAAAHLLTSLSLGPPERVKACLELVEVITDSAAKAWTCAGVAARLPATDRDVIARLVEQSRTAWTPNAQHLTAPATTALLAAAEDTLGRPDAPELLDKAIELARRSGLNPSEVLTSLAPLVVRRPAIYERLLTAMRDDDGWTLAVAWGVQMLAETDPARSVKYWRMLPETGPGQAPLPNDPMGPRGMDHYDKRRCLWMVMPALAVADLDEGLARARAAGEALGSEAARLYACAPAAQRARVMQLVSDDGKVPTDPKVRLSFAAALQTTDPALAGRLYADVEKNHPELLTANMSSAYDRIDPNRERERIEKELADAQRRGARIGAGAGQPDRDADRPDWFAADPVWQAASRLAAIDLGRALELVRSLPDRVENDSEPIEFGLLAICRELLGEPDERHEGSIGGRPGF
ncbi:MAG: carboxypeptidase regulatory-like domain-containing protein, partial [Armatimonadetes bacterium]|nr:carboxypeptidase regulatory-like domain-containing protein [Armatimonadota bacterium]